MKNIETVILELNEIRQRVDCLIFGLEQEKFFIPPQQSDDEVIKTALQLVEHPMVSDKTKAFMKGIADYYSKKGTMSAAQNSMLRSTVENHAYLLNNQKRN